MIVRDLKSQHMTDGKIQKNTKDKSVIALARLADVSILGSGLTLANTLVNFLVPVWAIFHWSPCFYTDVRL